MKADLHNHLKTSSRLYDRNFNEAIDIASQRLREEGMFGMVNFVDDRYERFIGLRGYERVFLGENKNGIYVPEKKIYVVKGQEVPTKKGHLLVIGLQNGFHMKNARPLEDSLKEAKDNNGIIIADHPFHRHGLGPHLEKKLKLLPQFDAIEIFNGESCIGFPSEANKKAEEFYSHIKIDFPFLGAITSSDGHSFYELGKCWTELEAIKPRQSSSFNSTLRKSIRKTNEKTPRQTTSGIGGAIDHILDMIFIEQIAPKIGLGRLFQTEDLNQRLKS